ncbi:CBS domain-containing protein [candidate division TA06 bacterium]|uniref:CBS domain-containing protein n=1 Tax=candidate division TA06 bacterium TaxID=2250710 RepID=A0A523UYF7_UNCT6|nr:MAG: CBS domain-containing protein [candidate division TA06 bacterium]
MHILTKIRKAVQAILRGKPRIETEQELREMIALGEAEGIITEEEEEMIESIFEIGETPIEEVMVPRVDMVCVPANASIDKIIDVFIKEGHSKIPVYDGEIDSMAGILYIDGLLRFWGTNEDYRAIEFVRLPHFVPESKKVLDTMKEFQEKRLSIAIVLDEYGGVNGLVTMEDLVEEIVGEFEDEFDKEEKPYKLLKNGSYVVSGGMEVDDLNDLLGTRFEEKEIHTLGGLITSRLERIPRKGEAFNMDGLNVQILEATKQRIYRVLIRKEGEKKD